MTKLKITGKVLDKLEKLPIFQRQLLTPNEKREHAAADKALADYKVPLRAAVEAALAEVNGRADRFTVTSYAAVRDVADRAEEMLAALPLCDRAGATVEYRPSGPYAKAYKHSALSTVIRLTRTSGGWWLTDCIRTEVWPSAAERFVVGISSDQAGIIARKALADFAVAEPVEQAA